MWWSQKDYYFASEPEAGLLLIEELCLLNRSEQYIIMNLYTRKTDVDLVRRAALCMSLNKRSRTEIHYLYEVSAKVTAHLCDIVKQATQLKSDVRVSMATRSGCERVVKPELYKEVTWELVQEMATRSGKRVVKSETHKEVTQESVHERQVISTMSDCKNVVKSESYEEVIINLVHGSHWREAINKELINLWEHCVWTIELLSEEWKAVRCKWVFKVKNDENRWVIRYKVRLVAQGFSQVYRVNFIETFASTIRRKSLRMFLIIVTTYNLKLHQMNVKAAYLIRDLWEENEDIYMWISKDIKIRKCDEELICHIQKSLYELKQSARLWNKQIVRYLKKHDFKNLNAD